MRILQYFIIFIALTGISISGCIKSSVIGDDILKNDEIGVEFIDTLPLIAKTVHSDSLRVYPTTAKSFLLGQLENPYIGKAKADLYLDFQTLGQTPDTTGFVFDSIILTVIVDTSLFYGDSYEKYHLEVFELNEEIRKTDADTFYANKTFDYKTSKIGESDFIPLAIDSVDVVEPGNDTVRYGEQLRIRLDDELGQRFLSDFDAIEDDTLFKKMFNGLFINTTVEKNSMIGVAILDTKGQKATKIEVYYTVDSTMHKSIFPIHNIVSHLEHNYEESEMEDSFDNTEKGDSFLYIQGMIGAKLEVEIPDLKLLEEKNLNKAALVLYTVDNPEVIRNLPSRLSAYSEDSLGNLSLVKDLDFSIFNNNPEFYYGYGTETEEDGIKTTKYNLNLTLFIKNLIKQNIYSTKLIIVPDNRINNPGFAKFYGVKNNTLRSKLNIIYSNIN